MRTRVAPIVAAVAVALAACTPDVAPAPRWPERVVDARRTTPGEAPPLLVLLHGLGGDEDDLLPLAARLDPRFVVVGLRAPLPHQGGHSWFGLRRRVAGAIEADRAQARATLGHLVRWLAAAPGRLEADRRRVFLLGFSQGAIMSLGALAAAPAELAGVVALAGHFDAALFDQDAAADAVARVPLFVAHGTLDDVLPVASGRAVRDHFGPRLRDFTYREYPVGHTVGAAMLDDVAAWLAARLGP